MGRSVPCNAGTAPGIFNRLSVAPNSPVMPTKRFAGIIAKNMKTTPFLQTYLPNTARTGTQIWEVQDEFSFRTRLLFVVHRTFFLVILISFLATLSFGLQVPAAVLAVGMTVTVGTFWLARAGRQSLAALVLVYASITLIMVLLIAGNGIHDIVMITFPITLLISSLILERRRYIVFAGLAIALVISLTTAEITGLLIVPGSDKTDLIDLIILTSLMTVTAVASFYISNQISRALNKAADLMARQAGLIAETNLRAEHLQTLNQIAAAVTSGLDLQTVLTSLYERVQAVVPSDSFSVALYDREARELSFPLFIDLGEPIDVPPEDVRDRPGLTAGIIHSRETLYLPDLHNPDAVDELEIVSVGESNTRTYLGIPMFLQDEVIGVMSVQSQSPDAYTGDEIRLLETAANHAAIAIQNARLYANLTAELDERRRVERELKRRDRILEAVNLAAGKFLSEPDWRANIRIVLQCLGEETGASHTCIYVIEPAGLALEAIPTHGEAVLKYEWTGPEIRALAETARYIPLGMDATRRWLEAMLHGEAFQCTRRSAEPAEVEFLVAHGLHSLLNCPIRVDGEFWGFLGVDDAAADRVWSEPEVDALQIASGLVGAAIQRQRDDAKIHRMNTELEGRVRDRTADLESFAYSVAHDLRAPLRGIDGYSKLLLEEYGSRLDADGVVYLQNVRTAASWMGQLIEDLLKLSRVTRAEMNHTRVDLSRMADDIIAGLKAQSNGRQIVWKVHPGLHAEGDPNLIHIALDNILSNAWKFTGRQPLAEIEIGAVERDQRHIFYVRDNGIGFDMSYSDLVFTPFQRLNPGDFEGTGIGLATVRRIIQRHGGEIWAESLPDAGSTFFFTLAGRPEPAQ